MAIKFSKTDDLDKMFENFASFPDVEKTVEFPEEKKKKAETATTKEAKKAK
ncbi:SPJ_0845 family protein [Streptococcus parasanguinis]|uniref:SPJ_0845 family protein n=1 Tax=Streptococcus parasanguinis TaxID=1318 RepID=UPI00200146AE|nr:SPJ_0845 family protein [Streptococcus parasanguinis]